ncbi:MAG TPA: MFS transporter [Stellaceae bacterium]|nr:MFS transporter [Stellaceae bacterium]
MGKFFGNRWWVVFASVCGLLVGSGAINVFAFGVFLKPVTEELGIGRGYFGSALGINSLMTTLGCFVLGWLLDRYGTRRVMIPGLILCAISTALYSTILPAPSRIYLLFGFSGLVYACQSPVPYANSISQWFDRGRGLALGIAMAGVGLGVAVVPKLAGWLIASYGWRGGYIGLGIAVMIIGWLPVALFLREPAGFAPAARRAAAAAAASTMPGMPAGQAFKTWRFWSFTLAFFIAIVAINGTLTQLVALLGDRGIPAPVAIGYLSLAGLALIIGRIIAGWCLDRFWGPYVAIGFFIVPMAGIALLASGLGGTVPLYGAVLCGLGVGAEVDLMAFFTSRYFGIRDYAKIYGVMFALFAGANGVGPSLSGWSFDHYHSYTPIFMVYEILLIITCGLFLGLGPYPYPAPKQEVVPGEFGKAAAE